MEIPGYYFDKEKNKYFKGKPPKIEKKEEKLPRPFFTQYIDSKYGIHQKQANFIEFKVETKYESFFHDFKSSSDTVSCAYGKNVVLGVFVEQEDGFVFTPEAFTEYNYRVDFHRDEIAISNEDSKLNIAYGSVRRTIDTYCNDFNGNLISTCDGLFQLRDSNIIWLTKKYCRTAVFMHSLFLYAGRKNLFIESKNNPTKINHDYVSPCCLHPVDNDRVLIGCEDQSFHLYDLKAGWSSCIKEKESNFTKNIKIVEFNNDYYFKANHNLYIFDFEGNFSKIRSDCAALFTHNGILYFRRTNL